ncbi:hypothetical protein Pla22_27560 [Rubripirellula amarantea]|uniref:Uncharacterized protein n=1 Tax=Rubripirellula amarantea TaxID=2527999 RepID=A0A5C5WYX0_9BACT|nr:hypothetical protein Pla22_27560 [Rubripirellula amarantea]
MGARHCVTIASPAEIAPPVEGLLGGGKDPAGSKNNDVTCRFLSLILRLSSNYRGGLASTR